MPLDVQEMQKSKNAVITIFVISWKEESFTIKKMWNQIKYDYYCDKWKSMKSNGEINIWKFIE